MNSRRSGDLRIRKSFQIFNEKELRTCIEIAKAIKKLSLNQTLETAILDYSGLRSLRVEDMVLFIDSWKRRKETHLDSLGHRKKVYSEF